MNIVDLNNTGDELKRFAATVNFDGSEFKEGSVLLYLPILDEIAFDNSPENIKAIYEGVKHLPSCAQYILEARNV